jgi:hypothetical protein
LFTSNSKINIGIAILNYLEIFKGLLYLFEELIGNMLTVMLKPHLLFPKTTLYVFGAILLPYLSSISLLSPSEDVDINSL